ncbi:MAG: hypothetical protein MUF00_07910 [Gemmatimonadaceae bacterium]|nr:hypothetical protein [Gemmatimonadaceae bacterium]
MRSALLILSGYNMRAVIALCRWAHGAGVPAYLVARHARDPIYDTAYRAQVIAERADPTLSVAALADWMTAVRGAAGVDQVVLVPSTEFLNRFLLAHRAALESCGGIVPLVDAAVYAQLSDKRAFSDLCMAHGIRVPQRAANVPDTVPFVAKPVHYGAASSGQIKPYLVRTAADRAAFLAREDVSRFYCEEYVEGESVYLLLHRARCGRVTATAQQNLMQQAAGGSIVLARYDDFHDQEAAQPYFRLLEAVGFHGLLMIEVRRDPATGAAVMIEANPRLWGPMQFTLDRHVDLFTPWLADVGVDVPTTTPTTPARPYYFWSGGLHTSAQPVAWHSFDSQSFVHDYPRIAACDLFARADTLRLHARELQEIAA